MSSGRLPAATDRSLVFTLHLICVCCFCLLLLLLSGNVFVRIVPVAAFYWFDEVVEWMFARMVFFGAAALWARDEHFRREWISNKLKGTPAGHLSAAAIEVVSLAFIAIFCYQFLQLALLPGTGPRYSTSRGASCTYACRSPAVSW